VLPRTRRAVRRDGTAGDSITVPPGELSYPQEDADAAADEALERVREQRNRVFVTPAIHWQVGLYSDGAEFGFTQHVLGSMGYQDEVAESIDSVATMRAAGVRVLPGGDFGLACTPHGACARDLRNFVELFAYPLARRRWPPPGTRRRWSTSSARWLVGSSALDGANGTLAQ
jgi:hypothetical protein